MKRIFTISAALFTTLLMFLMLSGCVTVNQGGEQPNPAPSPSPLPPPVATAQPARTGLTDERLMNAEYLSPLLQVPVSLVDGAYSGRVDGMEHHVAVLPGIQYGDLNGDGIEDAALILSEDTGGSGVFTSLVVVFSREGQFAQAPGVMIDDRPVIKELAIADGVVRLKALVHAPNDPAIDPTTSMNGEYSLLSRRVVLTRLTSAFGGGGEHVIFIESPVDGEVVSGTMQVKGSMPIGPFENNLALMISDPLSGQLAQEGFMVQSPDMGAPATFNNTIAVPDVPAGTQILLVLSELSMEDGTPMALDSVLLTVGQ